MPDRPIFALSYDFDKTLSPRNMQEYAFIDDIGMTAEDFWAECNSCVRVNHMDDILAYMYVMRKKARGKFLLTRRTLSELGRGVELFPGVDTWFARVNAYAERKGIKAEHYIISSGLKEIIEGTPIAGEFERIYAAEYCYDEDDIPVWPAMAVNYTSKTQFLYRINKGVFDVTDSNGLNEFMPEEKRRVPFRNMVYIGDGYTDVPCMRVMRTSGGHAIAVFSDNTDRMSELVLKGRADYAVTTDYSAGSDMEKVVFSLIDLAAAEDVTAKLHAESMALAQRQADEKRIREWEAQRGADCGVRR